MREDERGRKESKVEEMLKDLDKRTSGIFSAAEIRRKEIDSEFLDKFDVLNNKLEDLENLIKSEVKKVKQSVKGKFMMAVFASGRITWKTEKLDNVLFLLVSVKSRLDKFISIQDELSSSIKRDISDSINLLTDARNEGEPSVSIRKR